MTGVIVYFVLCSMTGVRKIGIWFLWIRVSLCEALINTLLSLITNLAFYLLVFFWFTGLCTGQLVLRTRLGLGVHVCKYIFVVFSYFDFLTS